MSPEWKPPISLFHHGMPHMAMLRPLTTLSFSACQEEGMSPFQTIAPNFWLPG